MQFLVLLDQPHHGLGLVADVLGRLGELQEASQGRRIETAAGRPQDPELQVVLHLVQAVLEMAHLGGQAAVGQHERAVRQSDRRLGQVLHLDQHVDRPVQVREVVTLVGPRRLPHRCRSQLPEACDAVGGAS